MPSSRKVLSETAEASPPSGWAPFGGASDFGKNMGIAFAALLIALALAFTVGALLRRHLFRRHRQRHHAAAMEKPNPAQLVAQPLEAIPAVVFSAREGLLAAGVAECAICLLEFSDGDAVRVLPNCSHGFHVECIDLWIASHQSCPTCRKSYLPQP